MKKSTFTSMLNEIKELVEFAINDKTSDNKFVNLGLLSSTEVKKIKAKTSLDLSGYSRILDKSSIKHTIKQHGNIKKEQSRGQIAITPLYFELVKEIAKSENLIYCSKNKLGNDCLFYEAFIGKLIFYIEEVRVGRKQLCLQTMYKRKKPTQVGF